MPRLLPLLAAVLIAALPAAADERPATLSLTGEGTVMVTPDVATVSIGVETQAENAGAALQGNSRAAAEVIAILKDAGVKPEDVQTQNFSVFPVYAERRNQPSVEPRVAGYRVTNQVSAKIRDLDGLGALLDRVVGAGANRINAISFGVDDPAAAEELARVRAVEDATAKARTYAEAAVVGLGPILSIAEGSAFQPPQPQMSMMRSEAAMAAPIERGSQAITATVQIVWEIRPANP